MFKYLKRVPSKLGLCWDFSGYYDSYVKRDSENLGESGALLIGLDQDNQRRQILHDALVRAICVDFSNTDSADNVSEISIKFELEDGMLDVFYYGVKAFCFGQRGDFSVALEVDIHELVFCEGWYEHKILCHGSEKPLFVICEHLKVEAK
jgi:hypothetical protein